MCVVFRRTVHPLYNQPRSGCIRYTCATTTGLRLCGRSLSAGRLRSLRSLRISSGYCCGIPDGIFSFTITQIANPANLTVNRVLNTFTKLICKTVREDSLQKYLSYHNFGYTTVNDYYVDTSRYIYSCCSYHLSVVNNTTGE